MHWAVLTLDAEEGRNHASQRADLGNNVYRTVGSSSLCLMILTARNSF